MGMDAQHDRTCHPDDVQRSFRIEVARVHEIRGDYGRTATYARSIDRSVTPYFERQNALIPA
jgi:hypothetical protein